MSGSLLIAVGGLSFSGKSTLSLALAEYLGAEVIRSDAVRKELVGVPLKQRAPESAYLPQISELVYATLTTRALDIIKEGRTVILDATFLRPQQRQAIESAAATDCVRFAGLWCYVDDATARKRAALRVDDISDADIGIYKKQLKQGLGMISWYKIATDGDIQHLVQQAISFLTTGV